MAANAKISRNQLGNVLPLLAGITKNASKASGASREDIERSEDDVDITINLMEERLKKYDKSNPPQGAPPGNMANENRNRNRSVLGYLDKSFIAVTEVIGECIGYLEKKQTGDILVKANIKLQTAYNLHSELSKRIISNKHIKQATKNSKNAAAEEIRIISEAVQNIRVLNTETIQDDNADITRAKQLIAINGTPVSPEGAAASGAVPIESNVPAIVRLNGNGSGAAATAPAPPAATAPAPPAATASGAQASNGQNYINGLLNQIFSTSTTLPAQSKLKALQQFKETNTYNNLSEENKQGILKREEILKEAVAQYKHIGDLEKYGLGTYSLTEPNNRTKKITTDILDYNEYDYHISTIKPNATKIKVSQNNFRKSGGVASNVYALSDTSLNTEQKLYLFRKVKGTTTGGRRTKSKGKGKGKGKKGTKRHMPKAKAKASRKTTRRNRRS